MSGSNYSDALAEARRQMLIVLEAAKTELLNLIRQRQEIDAKIVQVQNDIVKLAPLCGVEISDPVVELGLTDAIRYLLSKSRPLTPVQIKDSLEASKFPLPESNPLASIHTILRRLEVGKEVIAVAGYSSGAIAWRWIGKAAPIPPIEGWIDSFMKRKGKK